MREKLEALGFKSSVPIKPVVQPCIRLTLADEWYNSRFFTDIEKLVKNGKLELRIL